MLLLPATYTTSILIPYHPLIYLLTHLGAIESSDGDISEGMTTADPNLVLHTGLKSVLPQYNYYTLAADSPAIGAACCDHPPVFAIEHPGINPDHATICEDVKGVAMGSNGVGRDIGADAYNDESLFLRHPLTLHDVGPSYLRALAPSHEEVAEDQEDDDDDDDDDEDKKAAKKAKKAEKAAKKADKKADKKHKKRSK